MTMEEMFGGKRGSTTLISMIYVEDHTAISTMEEKFGGKRGSTTLISMIYVENHTAISTIMTEELPMEPEDIIIITTTKDQTTTLVDTSAKSTMGAPISITIRKN